MSKCLLGIEQSCEECRMCVPAAGKENEMHYNKFTAAVKKHMKENRERIKVIEDFMVTNPDADEKECRENIFTLEGINRILGFITALNQSVLDQAIYIYGAETQTDIAIEEMSELTKALLKFRRAEKAPKEHDLERRRQDVYEEIADVIIMLAQLIMIYNGGFGEEQICGIIEEKVKRLKECFEG